MKTPRRPDAGRSTEILTEPRLLEQQLRAVQNIVQVDVWTLRLPSNQISWSDETCSIIGIDRQNFNADITSYLSFVHPDDRQTVLDAIEQAGQKQIPPNLEYRIVRPGGEVRHVHMKGQLLQDDAGNALLSGTVQDVTERKQSNITVQ
jgi:PAS domain S-box-containing protein